MHEEAGMWEEIKGPGIIWSWWACKNWVLSFLAKTAKSLHFTRHYVSSLSQGIFPNFSSAIIWRWKTNLAIAFLFGNYIFLWHQISHHKWFIVSILLTWLRMKIPDRQITERQNVIKCYRRAVAEDKWVLHRSGWSNVIFPKFMQNDKCLKYEWSIVPAAASWFKTT